MPDKLCSELAFRDDADHFKTSVLDNFSIPQPDRRGRVTGRGKSASHDPKVARRAPAFGRCCTDMTRIFRRRAGAAKARNRPSGHLRSGCTGRARIRDGRRPNTVSRRPRSGAPGHRAHIFECLSRFQDKVDRHTCRRAFMVGGAVLRRRRARPAHVASKRRDVHNCGENRLSRDDACTQCMQGQP